MAAFELALRRGADGIELDVRLSADGVPVVIHDARLERTTSGSGRVDSRRAEDLRRLDAGSWFNRRYPARASTRYRGLRIPLLSEVLDWLKEHGSVAYVELKRAHKAAALEDAVLRVIHKAGVAANVVVVSFHPAALERFRRLDENVALGLDCTRPLLAIRRARLSGASVVLPLAALASNRFVERAHAAALGVVPWGAETPGAWSRLLARGVDGLITNRPDSVRRLVGPRR